jgi:dihydropteroate synthase
LALDHTLIMGVLNVTPDSFSDGGRYLDVERAVEQGVRMAAEGAEIIDVGGESSRPGSDPVSAQEELDRVGPVIERLAAAVDVPISIDSYKPETVDACLGHGASMANDIGGLRDPGMIAVIAKHRAPVVIMHMRGEPKTMQRDVRYDDVVGEVKSYLAARAAAALEAGVCEVIVDPGIGFGKTAEHNLQILKRLDEFRTLGLPLLVGPSRKSFIGAITGASPGERLEGTIAAVTACVLAGVDIVRVHDVKPAKQAIAVAEAIRKA